MASRWAILFRAMAIPAGGLLVLVSLATTILAATLPDPAQQTAAAASSRQLGAVKGIKENTIVLVTDAGAQINVAVQESARLLRADPGQTDLKTATPIELREIQVGDRILVRGKASEDGQSLAASLVVAIKKEAIEQKRAREREDWRKRGLGGLVKGVDPVTRSITITTTALAGSNPVIVHLSSGTVLRRYASNSVRYDDSKPGKFEEIKPGDQFQGRGNRSAGGGEFAAEEIITGSFRSIAGTVSSINAGAKTLTVADLISKHPVVVRVTPETSLHVLPAMMAEGIAMRLKGEPPSGPPNGPPPSASGQAPPHEGTSTGGGPPTEGLPGGGHERGIHAGRGPSGGPSGAPGGQAQIPGVGPGNEPQDFQQMIARLPAAKLSDFPKGEAVMIVATAGSDPGEATAINLVGGVEPLLRASPEGGEPMMLSPWSLGGPAPEGGGQ
ncbi:MAG: hypothetical protein HY508_04730 [Acidobacteria bacterium]|nr:hypothetical protein [Acidobacteriota bacterium]